MVSGVMSEIPLGLFVHYLYTTQSGKAAVSESFPVLLGPCMATDPFTNAIIAHPPSRKLRASDSSPS
jgi:hypothetical protein